MGLLIGLTGNGVDYYPTALDYDRSHDRDRFETPRKRA